VVHVEHRIVVHGHPLERAVIGEPDVVLFRILQPGVEKPVVVGAGERVVEL
jgi:hypothetical protein